MPDFFLAKWENWPLFPKLQNHTFGHQNCPARSLELQDVVVLVLVATTQSGLVFSEVFRQVGENIRGVTGIKGYRGRPTYWPEDG